MTDFITQHLDVWTSALLTKSSGGRGSNGKHKAYGIKTLRKLILELAVRGKLVPQNPNDEPASALLTKIATQRSRLEKVGKIRKQTELFAVSDDEKTFQLPNGWEWVKLGELTEMFNGRAFKSTELGDKGLPIIRIQNLNDPTAPFNYFAGDLAEQHLVEDGTLLISWSGTPGTSFGAFIWNRGKAALNQHINKCLVFLEETNLEYLRLSISSRMDNLISGAQGGVGLKHVTRGTLNNIVFAYPPLAEQHRIVAKVDELMALCDQLEQQQGANLEAHETLVETLLSALTRVESAAEFQQAWQRIATHFDTLFTTEHSVNQLKQTIFQLAVLGRLVPQMPDDEPAIKLFSRIQNNKEEKIRKKFIKRMAVEPNPSERECAPIPNRWLWTRLGAVFDVRDGTHDTPKYTEKGFPLITSKNIYTGTLSFDDVKFISEKDHLQIRERSRVDRGDILFAMIGTIGNPVIVDTDREFSIKNLALFKYYSSTDAEPRFLLLYLNLVSEEMKDKASGGVQSFVSLGFLRNHVFPLPPLAEQRRIVAKVDELMTLCDQLKARIQVAQTTQVHLTDALVAQALA